MTARVPCEEQQGGFGSSKQANRGAATRDGKDDRHLNRRSPMPFAVLSKGKMKCQTQSGGISAEEALFSGWWCVVGGRFSRCWCSLTQYSYS